MWILGLIPRLSEYEITWVLDLLVRLSSLICLILQVCFWIFTILARDHLCEVCQTTFLWISVCYGVVLRHPKNYFLFVDLRSVHRIEDSFWMVLADFSKMTDLVHWQSWWAYFVLCLSWWGHLMRNQSWLRNVMNLLNLKWFKIK